MLCKTTSKEFKEYIKFPVCWNKLSKKLILKIAQKEKIKRVDIHKYKFGHIIPLCLGGSNHLSNLWAEPINHVKDKQELESELCKFVENNLIDQDSAIEMILRCKASNCKAPSLLNLKYFKN